ncbi:MAG: sulfite exporter TauE/SafE family protein, partial [Microbacteriaceae bacterium]|nr:sulfite exporter TauE/SafE family protein [Microbacteriaceae bacterium]
MIDLALAAEAAPALTGIDFGYTLAGIVTGLVVGITGVGGGAVMTPILILLLGVAPATAVATDLWFAAITKLFGAGIHGVGGNIDWQVVRRLWMGSIPVAIVVAILVALNAKPEKVSWLTTAIGVVVLVTAIGMFLAPVLIKAAQANRTETPAKFRNFQAPATIASGGVVGGLVALTSVGAGALGSVAMTALYPYRMTPHRLVATDIAHAIPLAVVAGTGYIVTGLIAGIGIVVDPWMLASMLLGSIPTIIIGSFVARKVRPRG